MDSMPASLLKPLVLTMGNGIGPEITAQWINQQSMPTPRPLYVVGDIDALSRFLPVLPDWVTPIPVTGTPGDIAYQAIVWAVEALATEKAAGLVTGPISKQALWDAGHAYNGHTELLSTLAVRYWKTPCHAEMLFVHQGFRLLLLTRHVPLAQVSAMLQPETVYRSLATLVRFLQTVCHVTRPNLAMLGVNPHAGEIGGEEEQAVLIPVSQRIMQETGSVISLPMPADGFFRGFKPDATPYDAIVAPYHDQGLIPFKLLAGWEAVNVTIGLPFLRTSVSHGTAEDIVGHNKARPDSLAAAYHLLNQWV